MPDASAEALVIFTGPDAYITPEWYRTKQETGRVVPTWNYIVALAHATDHPDWDDPALLDTLSATARRVTLSERQTLGVDLRVIDALR